MFEFTQGIGDVQGIGHHNQARLLAKFGNHRSRGAAAVDNDPRVFADPRDRRAGDSLFISRDRLANVGHQLLRHGDCTAITTQQQTIAFERCKILSDRNFRGFETLGQLVHTDFTLLIEQSKNVMAALRRVAF
ncbi:hypothetical protein D3C73_1170230 [compost metagenome]